jgi:DNA-binding protein YbaB
MFGDMSEMMNKLKEAQQKVELTKTRLNTDLITETSANGQLKISLTANREIKSISINNSLLSDAEEL